MTITGLIDASTYIRLEKMADEEHRPISEIVGDAIDSFFEKMGSPYPSATFAAESAQGRASQEAGRTNEQDA